MSDKADKIFDKKVKFLASAEKKFDDRVVKFQDELLDTILLEYLPLFDIENGSISNSAANIALLNSVDNYFDRLEKNLHRDVLGFFSSAILESTTLSAEYYVGLGFKRTVVSNILKNKISLESLLGITPSGKLKKDKYLYRLGKTEQARQQLKDYVLKNLTGDVSFMDFQLGFRNLVIGNKRVKPLATTGFLQRYFDQYAYDKFNEFDAFTNNQFAAGLGLKHFIYEGSLISTSRNFCAKRAGKAFRISETKSWKNDPDLIDKKTKNAYRPLIERGRYRCRHFIKYITEELYNEITNNAKEK